MSEEGVPQIVKKPQVWQSKSTWKEMCEHYTNSIQREGGLDGPLKRSAFVKWFMTKEYLGHVPFDYRMTFQCYNIQKQLTKDRDYFTVIDGQEGEGKTTLAVNQCAWVSPSFNMDDVCFTFEDFLRRLKVSNPGDSILVDEGANLLFSRDAMQRDNRGAIKIVTQVRYKCIHICIAIPNFHIIDTYVREHRTKLLVHILTRGTYKAIIDRNSIKKISLKGKQGKNVNGIALKSGTFYQGNFRKDFPITIPYAEYDEKKSMYVDSAIEDALEKVEHKWVKVNEIVKKYGITKYMIDAMDKKGEVTIKKLAGYKYVNAKEMEERLA